MRRVISAAGLTLLLSLPQAALARTPDVSSLDARARALGNRKGEAIRIGEHLFRTTWPAQILSVRVDGVRKHAVAGLALSGVKFHQPLTRSKFIDEVHAIVKATFAVSGVEEVDLWCSVPLSVGKGVVVSGDLAVPTFRTVFAVTVLRTETGNSLAARLRAGDNVFWDSDWERKALRPG